MDWFEFTDTNNKKCIVNARHILSISYSKDTDLTVIEYDRAAFPATYIHGNYLADFKRLLIAHESYVTRIGE